MSQKSGGMKTSTNGLRTARRPLNSSLLIVRRKEARKGYFGCNRSRWPFAPVRRAGAPVQWLIAGKNRGLAVSSLTRLAEWQALEAHAAHMKQKHLRELFDEPGRFDTMSIHEPSLGMLLDYSKNRADA